MTRIVVEWVMVGLLLVMVLVAIAGCGRPTLPPYLCRAVVSQQTGETALLCQPYNHGGGS